MEGRTSPLSAPMTFAGLSSDPQRSACHSSKACTYLSQPTGSPTHSTQLTYLTTLVLCLPPLTTFPPQPQPPSSLRSSMSTAVCPEPLKLAVILCTSLNSCQCSINIINTITLRGIREIKMTFQPVFSNLSWSALISYGGRLTSTGS